MRNYRFSNQRRMTRPMLTWWAYQHPRQTLLRREIHFDIEHIYARSRMECEPLKAPESAELLGNKSLLEQQINIRAADYRFSDKVRYYKGSQKGREATKIAELLEIADEKNDFTEEDILERNESIIKGFLDYLGKNGLLQ